MALENLEDGMTGLQMADAIKSNFDKVLNAESAENKAENAGKSIKTDYDATRYIELQLADGTPVKMKMDVFCQAIAPVVAGLLGIRKIGYISLPAGEEYTIGKGYGILVISLSNSGRTTIISVSAQSLAAGDIIVDGSTSGNGISTTLDTENFICINRRATNGDIILQNKLSKAITVLLYSW